MRLLQNSKIAKPQNCISLYLRYVMVSLRGQMQYRASCLMSSLAVLLVTGAEFGGLYALFGRFGTLRGWTLAEVGLFYGIIYIAFGLAEMTARDFDLFSNLVRGGGFDRLLLRPRSAAFQVAASSLPLHRLARIALGLTVLCWAARSLSLSWTPWRLAVLLGAIAGGACLFTGLFIFQATMAFWTVETLEIMNTVTYGGTETGQYPLSIYRPWFRRFFTFVVPLACVTYFPALAILGRADAAMGAPAWLGALSPLVGGAFLAAALAAWRVGVRHYRSTGS